MPYANLLAVSNRLHVKTHLRQHVLLSEMFLASVIRICSAPLCSRATEKCRWRKKVTMRFGVWGWALGWVCIDHVLWPRCDRTDILTSTGKECVSTLVVRLQHQNFCVEHFIFLCLIFNVSGTKHCQVIHHAYCIHYWRVFPFTMWCL